MRKLTRKSLQDLAIEMPILSEVEQRHCIGGDVVVVNRNGQFIGNDDGHYAENIEGYAQYANDPNKTIWVVVTERGRYYDSMISSGADSVKNNHHSGQTDKGTDLKDMASLVMCCLF